MAVAGQRVGGGRVTSPAGDNTGVSDDHKEAADPSCTPSGFYSPCHRVIPPSRAAIALPMYQHPYSHAESPPFCHSSFCVLRFDPALSFPSKLQQAFGGVPEHTKEGRERGKREEGRDPSK